MIRILIASLITATAISAQMFQPPSWPQSQKLEQLTRQRQQMSHPPIVAQAGPVTSHPISGKEVRHSSQTLLDGTVIDHDSDISYFYRDSSGRVRDESPNRVEIFDNVGNFEYDMNPAKKTYTKLPLSGREKFIAVAVFGSTSYTSTSSDPDYGAHQETGGSEDLGTQVMSGIIAKHSRVTVTIPAGAVGNNRDIKVTNDRWYSDNLQLLIKSVNTDPRFGVNEYELTNINQAAPDPLLFMPPVDYTQVTRDHR